MQQTGRVVEMTDETTFKRFVAELARLTGFSDTLLEKDVWQKLALQHLYSGNEAQRKLIFKGGTCITRTLLGYYRFSEDLDFAWNSRMERNFYKKFEREHLEPLSTIGARLGKHYGTLGGRLMKWDLVCGGGKLVLSVNFSQDIVFPVQNREVLSIKIGESERRKLFVIYPRLSSAYFARLEVPCYSPEEIVCEKLSAILTRRDLSKPRDLVDLLRLQNVVNLPVVACKERSIGKIRRLVHSAPAYLKTFNERRKDVSGYLWRLVEEAENERALYIEPIDRAELERFSSKTLSPILEKIVKECA